MLTLLNNIPHLQFDFQTWMQSVGFFEEFFKGVIIGILVSAPMGPVGILTVQRTLNKGRWEGFHTGVGACISDLLYAIITGYFMFLVVDIIENPVIALWIKIVSAVLFFIFGVYTFRSKPKQSVADEESPVETKNKYAGFIISGFAFTVANPLIILLFMPLFGQFTFILAGNFITQVIGYVGIVCGALSWWLALTWLIDKVRNRFNNMVIWWINRVIGITVMTVSALMLTFAATGHSFPIGQH